MKFCLNILIILSILISVCFIVVCVISYFENRKLTVTEYKITDAFIPSAFHGFNIVQLSDLHNACFGTQNEELIRKIRDLEPDLILVTGDMIVGKPGTDVNFAAATMNKLTDIAPVYFSMGNHELRTSIYTDIYGDMWECFKAQLNPKVNILSDDKAIIKKDGAIIYLYGVSLNPHLYRRLIKMPMEPDYLESVFGVCDKSSYNIFLAHNPDYFSDYAAWGANLTFSGHVHGGMIRLPILGGALSPMIHFFPKYDKGLFCQNGKYMILSGGLGNHTLKFRVNNLPEIVSVTLSRK